MRSSPKAPWTTSPRRADSSNPARSGWRSSGTTAGCYTAHRRRTNGPNCPSGLCAFANVDTADGFLHPAVRAVLAHFWLGHDHPFADGNGRTARALFYWPMLRSGYWLAKYTSISSIPRKAPAGHTRSYLYAEAETDSNDATYFVVYLLRMETVGILTETRIGREFEFRPASISRPADDLPDRIHRLSEESQQ